MSFKQPQVESLLEKAVLDRGIPLLRGYGKTLHPGRVDSDGQIRVSALSKLETFPEGAIGNFDAADPQKANQVQNGVFQVQHDHRTQQPCQRITGTHSTTVISSNVHAEHVVGCDGTNSTVRRVFIFATTDLNFENDWLIVDLVSFQKPPPTSDSRPQETISFLSSFTMATSHPKYEKSVPPRSAIPSDPPRASLLGRVERGSYLCVCRARSKRIFSTMRHRASYYSPGGGPR